MQKDVRLGLIIGVLFLGLIVVIWLNRERELPEGTSELSSQEIEPILTEFSKGIVGPSTPAPLEGDSPAADQQLTVDGPSSRDTGPPEQPARTYTILPNDSLWKIAEKFYQDGTKWRLIHDANKTIIPNPETLPVGKKLIIPPATAERPVPLSAQRVRTARTHVVKKGEGLYSIARDYYGDEQKWKIILDANKSVIRDPEKDLKAGMTIIIPKE